MQVLRKYSRKGREKERKGMSERVCEIERRNQRKLCEKDRFTEDG